jgi:hypothetical protein
MIALLRGQLQASGEVVELRAKLNKYAAGDRRADAGPKTEANNEDYEGGRTREWNLL